MRKITQQVTQQQEDNRALLIEVERIKAEFHKSQETTPTVVQTRILDFNNAGSSENRQNNTIPTAVVSPWWGQLWTTERP